MIDFRHHTFLALCKLKNYTKTAEYLCVTQPAVTQHIKYLENFYGGKLIDLNKGEFNLTQKGKLLLYYTQRMVADAKIIFEKVNCANSETTVNFGATLTIGEFIMPPIINKIMKSNNNIHFNMIVENTKTLLEKLENGEISFAFLEGFFDKSKYDYKLFSKEKFICICSAQSPLSEKNLSLNELLNSKLILREDGSGTRDIFEQILFAKNLRTDSFAGLNEIGNMNALKKLIINNNGISFLYEAAVKEELANKSLSKINIKNFDIKREFNFVYLKNSIHKDEFIKTFNMFRDEK